MFRDQDYVVNEEGEVMIVDEFTGRIMRTPLFRRTSSGNRGEGACKGKKREQDPCDDHIPELI